MAVLGDRDWRLMTAAIVLIGFLCVNAEDHPGMCPADLLECSSGEDKCQSDDDCPAIQRCCLSGCHSRCSPIIQFNEASYPDACPMPMCLDECPRGQDYGTDAHGCMTCTCVDVTGPDSQPAERTVQEEEEPSHPECEGDLVWNVCGSPCTAMCNQTTPKCIRRCEPRCECPFSTPMLHNGHCVTVDYCKENCPEVGEGQVWTQCGTVCTPTCADRNPSPCSQACMPRCSCPPQRPLWDEMAQRCTDDMGCPVETEKRKHGNDDRAEKAELNELIRDLEELEKMVLEA